MFVIFITKFGPRKYYLNLYTHKHHLLRSLITTIKTSRSNDHLPHGITHFLTTDQF